MNKGTLAFSLNGDSMGVAYTDSGLTKGPIYPAVSLLHCAGCIIKGELPIPAIFNGLWEFKKMKFYKVCFYKLF